MPLSRRDILAKCMALGVVTSTANLLPSALAEAWDQNENIRQLTPPDQLGPFYKRRAPGSNALREAGDPGMPLVVTGQIFDTRSSVICNGWCDDLQHALGELNDCFEQQLD